MTAPERDDEFEAFLKRRSLLPDGVDRVEPPEHLDEVVLNEARKAVRAEGWSVRAARQPVRAARWARPVALAATILLCLSIVLNVTLNTNRPDAGPGAGLQGMTAANEDKVAAAGSTGSAESAPASAPAARMADRPAMKKDGEGVATGNADSYAAEGTAAPAPEEARRPAANGSGALVAQDAMRSAAVPEPRARRDAVAQNSAPASPPAAAGARLQDEMRQRELSASPVSASAADVQSRAETEAAKLAAPAAQEPLAEQKPAERTLAKRKAEAQPPPHPQDPKVWLQQIETLRSQGKTAQADAEMQRFRAVFPDYPIERRRPDTP